MAGQDGHNVAAGSPSVDAVSTATPVEAGPSSVAASNPRLALERDKKRIALRLRNLSVWDQGPNEPQGNLDSNLKKNTGYIKRVRQGLGVEAKPQLTKEAASLNLGKYVEELAQAVPEGLAKCTLAKDCLAAAEVGKVDGVLQAQCYKMLTTDPRQPFYRFCPSYMHAFSPQTLSSL